MAKGSEKVSEDKKNEVKIAKASAKYLRISPQKLNGVARQVRGLPLVEAENVLRFMTKKGAVLLLKVLKSAAANATSKSMSKGKLSVHRIEIGQGSFLKRGRPVSRGSFHPILKKTSHVLIELKEEANGSKS